MIAVPMMFQMMMNAAASACKINWCGLPCASNLQRRSGCGRGIPFGVDVPRRAVELEHVRSAMIRPSAADQSGDAVRVQNAERIVDALQQRGVASLLRLNQAITPATKPIHIAPKPLTKPAAGVIATRPTIIPLIIETAFGLPVANMSRTSHTSSESAHVMLVFSTAAAASALAKYGSPPLNPFQPSQSIPAPARAMIKLLGSKSLRSASKRGPTIAAVTKPETPAAKWMT